MFILSASIRIIVIVISLFFFGTGCSKKLNINPVSQNQNLKDVLSGHMPDGKVWMMENSDINIPGSFCQKDDTLLCN